MINLLLIGSGYWGQKYISAISNSFSEINLTVANKDNWQKLINKNLDGVIIATRPDSHVEIANYILEHNISVLIEKPLSLSLKEAEKLKQYNYLILINHIHLFSDAYQNIKEMVKYPSKITKLNTYGFGSRLTKNCSILWDYGFHDLAYVLDLAQQLPENVLATKERDTNLINIHLKFKNFTSYTQIGISNHKERLLSIDHDGISIKYNDLTRPKNHTPPLNKTINNFINFILGEELKEEYCGISLSLKIMKLLEACEESIKEQKEIAII